MKIKDGFILRKIAGEDIVVPIGGNIANFNGIINLNESAAFLWRELQQDLSIEELVDKLIKEYEINEEIASNDVQSFVDILVQNNVIEGI